MSMSFPGHIFKAYDIRGVYGDELDEEMVYKIGRSYAQFMKKDTGKDDLTLVVCQDMRDSSIPLKKEVIRGMIDEGIQVVDIGLASTPTFYFGVAFYGYDGGIQITASHNPAKYNGCKMVRARAVPVSGDTGIMEIRDMVRDVDFPETEKKGSVVKKEGVLEDQIKYALEDTDISSIKPFSIVVDTGNGMGSLLIEELFKHLPCKLEKMYFELDGTFPNHESNPFKEENNKDIQQKVVELGADLGIAMDGDADRLFFIDNTGKTVEPAIVRGILSQIYLSINPGAKICYDIRPGKITIDMIEEAGGEPVVTRVGHSLIKEKAMEVGAVFAGESSGHFFPTMPHGTFEVPEILILKFLVELSKSDKTLSEYTKPLYRYEHSGEINFDVEDKAAVFEKLKLAYGDNLKYDIDGLSFEWETHWFNVRASNTEDKVRLNLEAVDTEILQQKVEEISGIILGK